MKIKLGDITRIKTGKLDANASSEDGRYPFFTCSRDPLNISTYSYDCECVLVAGNGDLNVKYYKGKFDAYQRTYIIEDNSRGKLYMPYLYYFMKSYVEELRKQAIGGVIKYIKLGNLTDVLIELPSVVEQKAKVKILEKTKSILDKRSEELITLDDLIKARFVEMFGDPVLNDKRWEQKSLGDITTKIGSGATPKGGKETYQEKGITLIRSMNVHNGKFEYKDLAHISDEQGAKLDNVMIEENDVLLNITGASVARSCVVPNNILPARVNQHVCIIRCKKCIIPEFLNNLLIDDNYQELLWNIAGSGATREAITKQQVENLNIILPSIELQNEFIVFCKQIDKSKSAKAMKEFNCHIIYYMLHFIQNDFNKNNLNEK